MPTIKKSRKTVISQEKRLYQAADNGNLEEVKNVLSQGNVDINWANPDEVMLKTIIIIIIAINSNLSLFLIIF